jgi:hypothetical protein
MEQFALYGLAGGGVNAGDGFGIAHGGRSNGMGDGRGVLHGMEAIVAADERVWAEVKLSISVQAEESNAASVKFPPPCHAITSPAQA